MDLQLELLQTLTGHVMAIEEKLESLLYRPYQPSLLNLAPESSCKFCEVVGDKLSFLPSILQELLQEMKSNMINRNTNSSPPYEAISPISKLKLKLKM